MQIGEIGLQFDQTRAQVRARLLVPSQARWVGGRHTSCLLGHWTVTAQTGDERGRKLRNWSTGAAAGRDLNRKYANAASERTNVTNLGSPEMRTSRPFVAGAVLSHKPNS